MTFKRIIALFFCLCMLMGTAAVFSSCDEEPQSETQAPTEEEKTTEEKTTEESGTEENEISVLRFIEDVEAGELLRASMFQEMRVLSSEVPEGTLEATLSDLAELSSSYTSTPVFAGDYLVGSKISKEKPAENTDWIFTDQNTSDYVIAKRGLGDLHASLQKLIDDNPGKTIYFPDGNYRVSKPLVISGDPQKRVSLRLSQYAVITVVDSNAWEERAPIIHFAKGTSEQSGVSEARSVISGGTIDSKNVATAIKVDASDNILINHIALKNFYIGVHLTGDNIDVDSITGTGNMAVDSTGIVVEGRHNTITNVRMVKITYGIKLTGGENILRNLHLLYIQTKAPFKESVGFWDMSSGNFYDYCYSDQFATGFRLADGTVSVLNGCFAFWYKSESIQWGIHAQGKFESIVYATSVSMGDETADNAYIVVDTEGGNGKLVHPYGGTKENPNPDDDNPEYFKQYAVSNEENKQDAEEGQTS